jgi:hypothetical protein
MNSGERPTPLPDGVRAIGWIAEEGPYAHLMQEVDLDELLLAMAAHETVGGNYEWDDPTYISAGIYGNDGEEDEALVGWLRTVPCGERCPWRCEEDYACHIIKAAGPGRGAFLAVRFR